MRFNVSSKLFYNTAAAVGKVLNSKNALQILDNFLLTLQGNELTIVGMDVENFLSATIPVTDAKGEGSVCVKASHIISLLKEIPDQGVSFEVDERLSVSITYMSGEVHFVALPGVEYPAYEKSKEEQDEEPIVFRALASQFVKGIENTLFATSNEDYRPGMMGIYADIKPDGIVFVATDTRKLVRYTDNRMRPGVNTHCILPPKPAMILRSVFTADEELTVTMTSRSAEFRSNRFTFNCRFIISPYPDYNRVIPKNNNFVLTIDRETFMNSVRRLSLSCDQSYNLEKFQIGPDKIVIKSEDPNLMTSSREEIPCSFTGDNLVIGFGATYLLEILNVLKTQDITVKLGDSSRPGIFQPTENDPDTDLLILLMPMTVGEY